MKNLFKTLLFSIFLFFYLTFYSLSEIVNKIEVSGNSRISTETIKMFSTVNLNENVSPNKLNQILKSLYETTFFRDVKLSIKNNILTIVVNENPIIQNININGIKSKSLKERLFTNIKMKSRTSYSEFQLKKTKENLEINLKKEGYYFSKVDVAVKDLDENKVNVIFDITLGEKSKIKKISFVGNKIFKDRKLKNLIISEEDKIWKFLSNRKFLNEEIIQFDERLLRNFYLDKGFYNVQISSTFAKAREDGHFELIYNINSNEKVYFNDLNLILPSDFNKENFIDLKNLLNDLKGEAYSLFKVEKILNQVELISLNEEYESINVSVEEKNIKNKLDIIFTINESEKYFVEKINIFGNNVTQENVIRNQFMIDEGDPFNELLAKKSVNNVKSLGFFKDVKQDIISDDNNKTKIINISVTEKPTGEILAGAGFGSTGGTATFSVKENNYLGKGIALIARATITENSVKGIFSVSNPNILDSDKAANFSIESTETDLLSTSGYKSNRTGFSVGTNFEYYDDFFVGLSQSSFYEVIDTNASASSRQKSQEGNYLDSFINLSFDLDKRNKKYQTDDGFRNFYAANVPIISETYTLTNTYSLSIYEELYEDNISSFSIFAKAANSIKGDDIKLSERLFIPGSKLRGFEQGKVGPVDGNDFIGGNFVSALNFTSTLPQILPNSQNTDFLFFVDVANIWGVDYDSSIDDTNTIRSAVGIGVDWFTVLGPLNFSLTQPISKASTDKTENFRFNLGTTF